MTGKVILSIILVLTTSCLLISFSAAGNVEGKMGLREIKIVVDVDYRMWKDFRHQDPPPYTTCTNVSAPFNRQFLKNKHEFPYLKSLYSESHTPVRGFFLLDYEATTPLYKKRLREQQHFMQLQGNITDVKVHDKMGKLITIDDMCDESALSKLQRPCVNSVMQYFRNNISALDETIYDESGFFLVADWIVRLKSCLSNPEQLDDHTGLNMSCMTDDMTVIKPYAVLGDKPGVSYLESRELNIILTLSNAMVGDSGRQLWMDKLKSTINDYLHKYYEKQGIIARIAK